MARIDARHMLLKVIAKTPLEISFDTGVQSTGAFIGSTYDVNPRVVESCLHSGWLAREKVIPRFRESPRDTFRYTVTALGRHVAKIPADPKPRARRRRGSDWLVESSSSTKWR